MGGETIMAPAMPFQVNRANVKMLRARRSQINAERRAISAARKAGQMVEYGGIARRRAESRNLLAQIRAIVGIRRRPGRAAR